jgi:hypothetical protein
LLERSLNYYWLNYIVRPKGCKKVDEGANMLERILRLYITILSSWASKTLLKK